MMNGVKTTYTKDIDDLIYLLSCSLLGTTPDIERVNEMDLNYLYQLASFHSLVAKLLQLRQAAKDSTKHVNLDQDLREVIDLFMAGQDIKL